MNTCLWYPQSVDRLCRSIQSNGQSKSNVRSKADRIAHCLFFAVNQGGEFWNVIKKAAEQVITDYDLPKDAQIFLRNMADREDKAIADYLAPFMLNQPEESDTELSILIRKGLIYDLLLRMDNSENGFSGKSQKVSLEPLILAMCSQTTPNTSLNISSTNEERDMEIEQADDNLENIEVSYSTHLRERENVQKLLKDHSQSRNKTIEAIATPTTTKTFFDNLETPIIKKVVEDETPVLHRVLEPNSNLLMTQKDIKFNGNTSGLSEDMLEENLNDEAPQEAHESSVNKSEEGSPANFSKFSFNRTGGTGLDRSEVDEDFARLKIEGDTLQNSFENAELNSKLESFSKESLEPITGETLSRNSIPSAMHLESIGNSTFDVSPKRDLKNSTELQIDQSGDRHKFEQINDFDWSAINIEKIGGFKESTPLRCSEYNPVRSEIAVGSNGSCLRIFQLQNPSHSMEPILTLNKVHEASIYCCDYAFNGEYMATGSNDKVIKIMRLDYSPESGDTSSITTVSEMKNHDATIRKVQFLPNSTILTSGGGGDGRIYMTDCVNNQVVKYLDPGHLDGKSNVVTDITVANTNVLYSALNSCVYQWDVRSKIQTQVQIGNNIQTICCSKGEESNFIAAGGEDGSASFWDVRNPTVPVYRYNKHRKPVRSISMINDWLLCGSMDGLLSLHNLQQGIATVELEQSEKLINVRLGSDMKTLATTSSDGYFSFYKINF